MSIFSGECDHPSTPGGLPLSSIVTWVLSPPPLFDVQSRLGHYSTREILVDNVLIPGVSQYWQRDAYAKLLALLVFP
jgi:hypothetical protein